MKIRDTSRQQQSITMDSDSERKPRVPTKVTSRPFTWGPSDGLQAGGFDRAPTDELRLLFRKGAASFRLSKATRPWIKAQLQLYGIPFTNSDGQPELMETLKKAFRAGKCNAPTPAVEAAERALRLKYKAAVENHHELVQQWKDKKFLELKGGPTEEAEFDVDRFLAKYFLNGLHGQPDRAKTKEPVALDLSIDCHDATLKKAIQAIPGLAFHASDYLSMSVVGWDTELDRGIEREFAKLSSGQKSGDASLFTPTHEATYDFNRFLKKYFRVDVNGVATETQNEKKPSTPVTLQYLPSSGVSLVSEFAAKVPSFCVKHLGLMLYSGGMVLGWDVAKVEAEVARIEEKCRLRVEKDLREQEQRAAEDKAQREEEVRSIYRPHHEYVARKKSEVAKPADLAIDQLVGSYVVRWEGEEGAQYSDQVNNQLTLDVFPAKSAHGVTASFFFGVIEGAMLLALSEREVALLRDSEKKKDPYYEESQANLYVSGVGYGRDDNEGADAINLGYGISTGHGSADGPACPSTLTDKKRRVGDVADPWGVQAAMAKRQKQAVRVKKEEEEDEDKDEQVGSKPLVKVKKEEGEDAKPLAEIDTQPSRVYFQFAYNVVNGYPDVDDENEHVGYLDFDMSSSSGDGVFHVPRWFGRQSFSIFKIDDEPSGDKQPLDWFEFGGRRWGSGW
ncbi:hypothetical protein B0T19DRAFT_474813 [Cercophora scortea]|uniref:Uncharacterized protein n=1 Tax=Cercophora scortea TaxID=314031 RepID=A0AAE0MBY2_9PEZI|nr:hypothetical protein B0T19DRAFT_474813 [Cercophora scortea]